MRCKGPFNGLCRKRDGRNQAKELIILFIQGVEGADTAVRIIPVLYQDFPDTHVYVKTSYILTQSISVRWDTSYLSIIIIGFTSWALEGVHRKLSLYEVFTVKAKKQMTI